MGKSSSSDNDTVDLREEGTALPDLEAEVFRYFELGDELRSDFLSLEAAGVEWAELVLCLGVDWVEPDCFLLGGFLVGVLLSDLPF